MKIATIVGARPQFIKAASVSLALRQTGITEVLIHTGQHYDAMMSDVFFQELGLPVPDHHLGIGSGSHGAQTGAMLGAVEAVLMQERPDWVLVYGDTNSTLAGALATAKMGIALAHVEAGLRSFNKAMPEEINRLLTDHVADLLFAPTEAAVANLGREGIAGDKVRLVGDVMIDSALTFAGKADVATLLGRLGVITGQYVLATIHRAENTDNGDRLRAIIAGLATASRRHPVLLPLHPRTRAALIRHGLAGALPPSIILSEPLGFVDMLAAEQHAQAVVTDSGGVQKEACLFGIPCLVVRRETEWTDLIESGAARLVEPEDIAAALANCAAGARPTPAIGAAAQVAAALAERG